MIHIKIDLISLGCPRPSIALNVQNRGLQTRFIHWKNATVVHIDPSSPVVIFQISAGPVHISSGPRAPGASHGPSVHPAVQLLPTAADRGYPPEGPTGH